MILPKPLCAGDMIAVIAPAGAFDHGLLSPALDTLHQAGLRTRVMPHVLGHAGSYSGTPAERLSDFVDAWTDPEVRAILCARGGYGCVHLLEGLSQMDLCADPKWLIGFSDVSALHALLSSKGVASMHASMLKCLQSPADPCGQKLISALKGQIQDYTLEPHPYNRKGHARGRLVGGNLSVLDGLASTPYDMLSQGGILMIEDINEPVYKLERIMWRLRLSGALQRVKGLIVGQWTDCKGDKNYACVNDMIRRMVEPYSFPVIYNAPIGHVDYNVPMILGADVAISVTEEMAVISHCI